MTPAKRATYIVLLLLAAGFVKAQGLPQALPEDVGMSADRLTRIGTQIEHAIDEGQIAGAVAMVARNGQVAYFEHFGMADIDDGEAMQTDTLFRLASMTKPITSLAVMMLYEEGHFLLNDPVSKYLPALAEPDVIVMNENGGYDSVPALSEISIHDLLTHTSGIDYRFIAAGEPRATISNLYVEAGISDGLTQTEGRIEELPRQLGDLPLLFEPGTAFAYGLNTDVLGRLIEVVSGLSLAEFFEQRIFRPLGMNDTRFFLDDAQADRLASVYSNLPDGSLVELGPEPQMAGPLTYSASFHYEGPQTYYSGGAGLVSTASDYARFLQLMLNGGELDGVRLVGPKTVEFMTRNQIGEMNVSPGVKFGLGFGIVVDPGLTGETQSEGNYYWGGFFNTNFFVDPSEGLFAILLTQRFPSDETNLGNKFVAAVYQAIIH